MVHQKTKWNFIFFSLILRLLILSIFLLIPFIIRFIFYNFIIFSVFIKIKFLFIWKKVKFVKNNWIFTLWKEWNFISNSFKLLWSLQFSFICLFLVNFMNQVSHVCSFAFMIIISILLVIKHIYFIFNWFSKLRRLFNIN
jgi:hypothetical protein